MKLQIQSIAAVMAFTAASMSLCWGAEIDFARDVQPILNKYCVGCHGSLESNAELSLETHGALMAGSENGPIVVPGKSAESKLIQVLAGRIEPQMPPEGEPAPSVDDIAKLVAWIDAGAKPAEREPSPAAAFAAPELPASAAEPPVSALAMDAGGTRLVMGRSGSVLLQESPSDAANWSTVRDDLPGRVTGLALLDEGNQLVVASGISGLVGQIRILDLANRREVLSWDAHRDAIYAIALTSDQSLIASAGYDHQIKLWERSTGRLVGVLEGHNGAVFDLAFAPQSRILASASADATIKLWNAESGERLDTLSQPLKEQYSVDISPDGQWIVAGGADHRIRMWRLVSRDAPQINPIIYSRYAHEGAVYRLRFTADGKHIVSIAADRALKIWDAAKLQQLAVVAQQPVDTQLLAINPVSNHIVVGRMDGSLQVYPWPELSSQAAAVATISADSAVRPGDANRPALPSDDDGAPSGDNASQETEREPNGSLESAQTLALPFDVQGVIDTDAASPSGTDIDLYRFSAAAGETWIFEVQAARDRLPLDSRIRILDENGDPVPRVQLRALRDSYFTFRGKDSDQTGDFRLHNWEEMRLNQYLYASGEVVRLYTYPRGPDSGFNVYPNFGKRHGYFDTTPVAHALNEPCYIVEPHAPGEVLPPNGLPVFVVNYENDDDALRELGADSRLTFTAPASGSYWVAIEDVRGMGGPEFRYRLKARRPQPDFELSITNKVGAVAPGSGKKFGIQVKRLDGFAGPVRVDIDGLPDGLHVTTPLVVEAGQWRAWGVVWAETDAKWDAAQTQGITIRASAMIDGSERTKQIEEGLGEIEVGAPPPVQIWLEPDGEGGSNGTIPPSADTASNDGAARISATIGETSTARIRIERRDYTQRVGFGNEEAVINAPHGLYVDNIGLNGVLIVEGQNERTIFLTTEPWVEPTERWVFVESDAPGNPTSPPVRLRVAPAGGGPDG